MVVHWKVDAACAVRAMVNQIVLDVWKGRGVFC